jgi:tRNA(Ile)-lysidine synthetase-like protein
VLLRFSLIRDGEMQTFGSLPGEAGWLREMANYYKSLDSKLKAMKKAFGEEFRGVMVAHSGGADSTALFALICEIHKREKNIQLGVIHVNYGLRGEASDGDESFSRDLAARHGAAFHLRRVSEDERGARRGESVQEWARRLRYAEFEKLAREGWVIALAHHEDDLAENALLRLARGAGPGRLAGMRDWQKPYWRPLLGWRKAELLALLYERGLDYRVDASNDGDDYDRNVVRHRVLAELERLYPGASGRIAACARDAADLAAWCDERLAAAAPKDQTAFGSFVKKLASRHPGVALAALAAWFRAHAPAQRLTRRYLRRALRRVLAGGSPVASQTEVRLTRTSRRRQHAKALAGPDLGALLAPGSYASFSDESGPWRLRSPGRSKTAAESTIIQLKSLPFSATVRFPGQSRSWRLKNLLQLWQIPLDQRASVKVFYENDQAMGLAGIAGSDNSDSDALSVPDATGGLVVQGSEHL